MAATESKAFADPLIQCIKTFGSDCIFSLPGLANFPVTGDERLFPGIPTTPNLEKWLREKENPVGELKSIFPDVKNVRSRTGNFGHLARFGYVSHVVTGNSAVCGIASRVVTDRLGCSFKSSERASFAKRNNIGVKDSLYDGSNIAPHCAYTYYQGIPTEYTKLHNAADAFEETYAKARTRAAKRQRARCHPDRSDSDWSEEFVNAFLSKSSKGSRKDVTSIYRFGDLLFVAISTGFSDTPHTGYYPGPAQSRSQVRRQKRADKEGKETAEWWRSLSEREKREYGSYGYHASTKWGSNWGSRRENVLYVLTARDIDDLLFVLRSRADITLFFHRRTRDIINSDDRGLYSDAVDTSRKIHNRLLNFGSRSRKIAAGIGAFFDMANWRFQAYLAGDRYMDHSTIMRQKEIDKGFGEFGNVDELLSIMCKLPVDLATDFCSLGKISCYPDADPFLVVIEQRDLHEGCPSGSFTAGSELEVRFEEIDAFQWYLAVDMCRDLYGAYCGNIRAGVEAKPWHENYKLRGIPRAHWRDARDIDLTGVMPVQPLTNEVYNTVASSACAPSEVSAMRSFEAYASAVAYEKRKVLYSIQHPNPVDLEDFWTQMERFGDDIVAGTATPADRYNYTSVNCEMSTGARAERQKNTFRPFYQVSCPLGAGMSHTENYCRAWIGVHKSNLIGASYKEKIERVHGMAEYKIHYGPVLKISDDKKKYSPHMAPESQRITNKFFSELSGSNAFLGIHSAWEQSDVYYRVMGHLVSYPNNGTDKEGLRACQNTWMELCIQGATSMIMMERDLSEHAVGFLAFIDDAVRGIVPKTRGGRAREEVVKDIIDEIVLSNKAMTREMSWDKAFVSDDFFTMLGAMNYQGRPIKTALKAVAAFNQTQESIATNLAELEMMWFGKAQGAISDGCPSDLAHHMYICSTLRDHYRMGIRVGVQAGDTISPTVYPLYCITPIGLGGAGIRGVTELTSTESGGAILAGIGNLNSYAQARPRTRWFISNLMNVPLKRLTGLAFWRSPDSISTCGPKIHPMALAGAVRRRMMEIVVNRRAIELADAATAELPILDALEREYRAIGVFEAPEVQRHYKLYTNATWDSLAAKVCDSDDVKRLLSRFTINRIRIQARIDAIDSSMCFEARLQPGFADAFI